MNSEQKEPCGETIKNVRDSGLDYVKKSVHLQNRRGLHARASAKFCAAAAAWDANIKVLKDGYSAGGCSIMGLLTLGAGMGEEITIEATGRQAQEAMDTLVKLIEERFGEED